MTLLEYLDQENLTASEFGRKIGVSPAAMTRYMQGERFPNTAILWRILRASGGCVTPNDFLETSRVSSRERRPA
jgi:transcriptional regulator with XRE-family HTH domain